MNTRMSLASGGGALACRFFLPQARGMMALPTQARAPSSEEGYINFLISKRKS